MLNHVVLNGQKRFYSTISFMLYCFDHHRFRSEEEITDIAVRLRQILNMPCYEISVEFVRSAAFSGINGCKMTLIIISDNELKERETIQSKIFENLNQVLAKIPGSHFHEQSFKIETKPFEESKNIIFTDAPLRAKYTYNYARAYTGITYSYLVPSDNSNLPRLNQTQMFNDAFGNIVGQLFGSALSKTYCISVCAPHKEQETEQNNQGVILNNSKLLDSVIHEYYGQQKNNFWQSREGKPEHKVKHTFYRDESGDANNVFFRIQKSGLHIKQKALDDGKMEVRVNLAK